jgi:hypothetical protein
MSALPIPHHELAPMDSAGDISAQLNELGWTVIMDDGGPKTTLFAFRHHDLPDIPDPAALEQRLTPPEESMRSGEHLEVRPAEAPLLGRTRVYYRGTNPNYFRHVIGGLVEYGQQADTHVISAPQTHEVSWLDTARNGLRAHIGLEVVGSVAVAGMAYALAHHRKK